jgi:sulfate-transporting ATPase
MSIDPNKVIYSMIRVSKFYNKKPIIKDISLSYFYGAKIGVLGLNGSGKSTLLKIMAGLDKEYNGEDDSFQRLYHRLFGTGTTG